MVVLGNAKAAGEAAISAFVSQQFTQDHPLPPPAALLGASRPACIHPFRPLMPSLPAMRRDSDSGDEACPSHPSPSIH